MVKLFIGNIPSEATPSELKALFEQYGKVTECDIITNYGFVHMEDKKSADEAVASLNQYKLHGVSINVEHSRGKPKASTKLHVSSISPDCTSDELREKFEEYGAVLECDIVKDFAFVHMEKAEEALEAIRNLNNYEFKDNTILPLMSCIGSFTITQSTCGMVIYVASSSLNSRQHMLMFRHIIYRKYKNRGLGANGRICIMVIFYYLPFLPFIVFIIFLSLSVLMDAHAFIGCIVICAILLFVCWLFPQ